MPRAYPEYPYVEPVPAEVTDSEINQTIAGLLSRTPGINVLDGGPLDGLCRALEVDVEYAALPNEVLLDVPPEGRAILWLPRNGKARQDRLALAIGLGHWILQVPQTRDLYPGCGIQALYQPRHPRAHIALTEARRFAMLLLMPTDGFTSLWYEGRAVLVADTLNVPTQAVYDRAKALMLTDDEGGQVARR